MDGFEAVAVAARCMPRSTVEVDFILKLRASIELFGGDWGWAKKDCRGSFQSSDRGNISSEVLVTH